MSPPGRRDFAQGHSPEWASSTRKSATPTKAFDHDVREVLREFLVRARHGDIKIKISGLDGLEATPQTPVTNAGGPVSHPLSGGISSAIGHNGLEALRERVMLGHSDPAMGPTKVIRELGSVERVPITSHR